MSCVEHRALVVAPLEVIAKVCYSANRSWCQETGDNSNPIWECASGPQKESILAGVRKAIENPGSTPEQMHEHWCHAKLSAGWKHGPRKDERKKEHPCLLPYDKLPEHQRVKDILFMSIIRSFFK